MVTDHVLNWYYTSYFEDFSPWSFHGTSCPALTRMCWRRSGSHWRDIKINISWDKPLQNHMKYVKSAPWQVENQLLWAVYQYLTLHRVAVLVKKKHTIKAVLMEKPTLNILIIKIVIFTFPSFQSLSPKRQSCAFSSYPAQSSLHAASQLLPDLKMMVHHNNDNALRTLFIWWWSCWR